MSSEQDVIRINGDGTTADYVCILTAGDARAAVVMDGITGGHRIEYAEDDRPLESHALLEAQGS